MIYKNITIVVPQETYKQIQSFAPDKSIGDISLKFVYFGMKYLEQQKQMVEEEKKKLEANKK